MSVLSRRILFSALFAVLASALTYSLLQSSKNDESPLAEGQVIRPQVPNIEFKSQDQKAFELKDFRGKVVLLSFWASWCAPCKVELPDFESLKQKINHPDFEILAISLDEQKSEAEDFIDSFWKPKALSFRPYFNQTQASARSLDLEGIPANFVLDRKGREVFASNGLMDWKSERILKMIQEILAE